MLFFIEEELNKLPERPSNPKIPGSIKKGEPQRTHILMDREQTQLFTGLLTPHLGDKANTHIKMLTSYLSGQSSDLFTILRDELGLCYAVQPVYFNAIEGGYWGIYMATEESKVEIALSTISQILGQIKEKGIPRSDFNKLKRMIEGQNAINIQTNDDYCGIYSIPQLQGYGMDFHHQNSKETQAIKYEDFQKGVSKLLSGKWTTVTCGK